jgi:hypothetical protein
MKLKTILKFDTGANGFKAMMIVLAGAAVLVLGLGAYFILTTFR